jgi:hypothetical protein
LTTLHSRQIEFEFGLIHLNPPEREQVPRKYRPTSGFRTRSDRSSRAGPWPEKASP